MNQKGITLVELLMVMGLIALLFLISTISLAKIDKESQIDEVTSEIKISILQAQNKTINGLNAGIYFAADRFVFFYGDQFVEGDSKNQITVLPTGLRFEEINLPSNTLAFDKISGQVKNYSGPISFKLHEQATGKTRQIILNKLGVIDIR